MATKEEVQIRNSFWRRISISVRKEKIPQFASRVRNAFSGLTVCYGKQYEEGNSQNNVTVGKAHDGDFIIEDPLEPFHAFARNTAGYGKQDQDRNSQNKVAACINPDEDFIIEDPSNPFYALTRNTVVSGKQDQGRNSQNNATVRRDPDEDFIIEDPLNPFYEGPQTIMLSSVPGGLWEHAAHERPNQTDRKVTEMEEPAQTVGIKRKKRDVRGLKPPTGTENTKEAYAV